MRFALLRRAMLAVLMLAMASTWQIAPSSAAPPCQMNAGAADSHQPSGSDPCKSLFCACVATVCCQVSPNLSVPYVDALIDWNQVVYPVVTRKLTGLTFPPALHPPSVRV
jgi:hypothetical protein